LRGHLAVLKLHDAAEALPAVPDRAQKNDLSMNAALESPTSAPAVTSLRSRADGRRRSS